MHDEQRILQERTALTLEETRHVLRIGRTLMAKLIREGTVQTIKVGGRRLVLAESVRAILTPDPTPGSERQYRPAHSGPSRAKTAADGSSLEHNRKPTS